MKNKGIIISLIILLSIITFFLVLFLVICLKGDTNFINGFINLGSKKSTDVIFEGQFAVEDINNIEIKQDAGDIIFEESEDENIQVIIYGKNENDARIDLNAGKLNIDNTKQKHFQFLNFGEIKNDIIVYIPSNYSNEIKIKNDYGRCEIIDLENAIVDIDCDAGDIELGKVKDAIIKSDYGNIEIEEILNKCEIRANCGNIKVEKMYIQENSIINADYGDVYINDTNDIYIDADVGLGDVNINKNNRKAEITLKVSCDCGNIKINN